MPSSLDSVRAILEEKLKEADPSAAVGIADAILRVDQANGKQGEFEALEERVKRSEQRLSAIETHITPRKAQAALSTYANARRLG